MKVKYSKNQGDDFWWFFKSILMVLELHPGYVKVSWDLKECIPNLRLRFWSQKMWIKPPNFEYSINKKLLKNTYKPWFFHLASYNTYLYYLSIWSQKYDLRLGIHSLRPQDTFTYSGCNSRTIRTLLKNHQKSSPWFLLYFTFKKA